MPEPDPDPEIDSDFSAQLQALIIEAEEQIAGRVKVEQAAVKEEVLAKLKAEPAKEISPEPDKRDLLLQEVLNKVREIGSGQAENLASLDAVKKALAIHAILPSLLNDVKVTIERKNSVNKAMFDALHLELKDYKDAFILEAILRPVIRDLIALYDDATDIVRDMVEIVAQFEADESSPSDTTTFNNLRNAVGRAEHHLHFLLEVLERLQVTQMTAGSVKLDKRLQRAVAVESTADPDEEQNVVRIVKCGFDWREKLFRPEEVVIRKYRPEATVESAETQAPS